MSKTIAIIGTGIMGRGMALNLAKAGIRVQAYSRNPEKLRDLVQKSERILPFSGIQEATDNTDLTILCLTTDDIVQNAFQQIGSTKAIFDTGTTSLELTMKMHAESQARGISFFDCPMTGSKLAAESGEILFLFGGKEEDAKPFSDFLEICGRKTIYCGGIGKGQKVKFALNMVQAGIYEVLLEGLVLAEGLGVDPQVYYDVIDNSAAKSGISQMKLGNAIRENYETHFSLKNMYKDIRHSLHEAEKLGLTLPLCRNLEEVYQKGMDAGFGEEDFLSIAKIFRNHHL